MKKNIGTPDRIIRFILGIIALVAILFTTTLAAKIILLAIGLFSIAEALLSRCAFYALIGKNTCPIE